MKSRAGTKAKCKQNSQRASFRLPGISHPVAGIPIPGAIWEPASPVVTLPGRVQHALPQPTAQLQGSHAPEAEDIEVSVPAADLADSPHRPVHSFDQVLRCHTLGPLVADQRRDLCTLLFPSPRDVLQEPGVEHDQPHGDQSCVEGRPQALSADAHITELAEMWVLLQEPKDVSVEDLCKKRLCNGGPIVLRRRRNQADEFPQVRDLGFHPSFLRHHEILDALLQLRLHSWLIAADGKQEMVEAHVSTKRLVRCPSFTLHEEDHLGIHQLGKDIQHHRCVEAWLRRSRSLLWNLLL
mmetsp:Transcript_147333/g.209046  ORF Transcript_147333/g.209046 Transcript_147333/m.209046 type:complete len:296 (-) Transcript_147333:1245-2132(-)